MSIFGGLKKKKDISKKAESIKTAAVMPAEVAIKSEQSAVRKSPSAFSHLINPPHITEKAHNLVKNRQYIFNVAPRANKTEIKKAIENIYNVKVINVQTITIPTKTRRLGRAIGKKSGYKKAVITLKEGYTLEIMPQ